MGLIIAIGMLIIATLLMMFWLFVPKYKTLTNQTSLEESARLIEQLKENGYQYKLSNGGATIKVLEHEYNDILVGIAEPKNIFESKGLEIYENTDYSMTEHAQEVTYKRAIQGELERTISHFDGVKNARVHITFATKKLFTSDKKMAKASVTVTPESENTPNQSLIFGIQQLVASSVENLAPEHVKVISSSGRLLSITGELDEEPTVLFEESNSADKKLSQKIENILGLYLASSEYAVSVNISFNRDKRKEVTHSLIVDKNGLGQVVKEKKRLVESNTGARDIQPQEELLELDYAHGKKLEEVTYDNYEIERVSVAVAILADISGEDATKLQNLVKSLSDIDESRGDSYAFEVLTPLTKGNQSINNSLIPSYPSLESKAVLKNPEVEQPSNNVHLFTSNHYFGVVSAVLVVLLLPLFLYKRKKYALSNKQKEQLLVEINQWLTDKEVK